jgi:hypothetical protein
MREFSSNKLELKGTVIQNLLFTSIAVIDSTILKLYAFGAINFHSSTNIILFVSFSISLAVWSNFLIIHVNKNRMRSGYTIPLRIRIIHLTAIITQNLTVGIILILIIQMVLLNKYNLILLNISTYITHVSTLVFIILVLLMFLSWVRSKFNRTIVLYLTSLILISVCIVISMIYLEYNYSLTLRMDRKPYPIYEYIIRQEVTPISQSLYVVFDILYLLSFVTMWIATAVLLSQYRNRIGTAKYYILIFTPLIYYGLTFEGYFGSLFSSFGFNSPIALGTIYALAFSATKQVGALLFSIIFLTSSRLVANERVRISLLISAIGIFMIFGCVEVATLQYRLYPPFGLITQALMPLGAYLLFIGIFTSATSIANDAKLREGFYKRAESQLNLLKTIGVRQMEKELMKKFRSTQKLTEKLDTEAEIFTEEEDVQKIVREVLTELYSRKAKEEKI